MYTCNFCKKSFEIKNKSTVSNHLQWHCKEWKIYKETILTKDFLYNEHWVNGKSCNEIAQEHGVNSSSSINKLLKSYGIEVRSIKESKNTVRVRQKTEATNIEKYGHRHNFCKEHPSRIKWESELKESYDVINVFQRDDVKALIEQTFIERYGVTNPMHVEEIRQKAWNTTFERHGVYFGVLKSRKPHWQYTSKPQNKLYEYLDSLNILYEKEKSVYPYFVDAISNKTVIELFGDFWHANPIKYKETDILKFPMNYRPTAKDIWEKDKRRIEYIKSKGYNVIIIWENDINDEEKIKSLLETIVS